MIINVIISIIIITIIFYLSFPGYGNIAPKTDFGRLATIFYALFGIPLMLLCLANIGSAFGNCFRFIYKHFCDGLVWLCCPAHYSQQKLPAISVEEGKPSRPTKAIPVPPRRGKDAAKEVKKSSSDQISVMLNGSSSDVDAVQVEKHDLNPSTSVGLGDIDKGSPTYEKIGTYSDPPTVSSSRQPLRHKHYRTPQSSRRIRKEKKAKTLKKEVRVPLFVSLLIVAGYIFGGAVIFSLWQKNWDYLIGSYFCFITLSTIGFGDYVFGADLEWQDNQKLIICAVYLFFGLSVIAMCFDLMQEEVRAKFAWLGAKLGLIDKEDDDEDDDRR